MWTKLNDMMQKHDFPKPNFKIFMANSAQTYWNAIIIIYGSREPYVKMIDKDRTCLFHNIQLIDKHTKQLIKPKFQDQCISLCHQYKGTQSLGEVNNMYVLICCWWF